MAVRITNRSGQPLHLGADANWLTFSVESVGGPVVVKKADVPVQGEFDVGSSQVATKRVDLAPYFVLTQQGGYRVTATVRIKDWDAEIPSPPRTFDVIDGAKLWSQTFGLPVPAGVTNRTPEIRKYTLEEANYLRSQLRMYVQVSDESETHIFKIRAIGPMVSFSQPEAQLDRLSHLHVLYQSGARIFLTRRSIPTATLCGRKITIMSTRVRDYTPMTMATSRFWAAAPGKTGGNAGGATAKRNAGSRSCEALSAHRLSRIIKKIRPGSPHRSGYQFFLRRDLRLHLFENHRGAGDGVVLGFSEK